MQHAGARSHHPHYLRLLLMSAAHFAAMYALMYAMVDRPGNVYANLNQAYMAALMTAPMVLLELALMRSMYRNRRLNLFAAGTALLIGIGAWVFERSQTGIGDRQFLRSMIPHHAGAILMCEQAAIGEAAILDLCRRILASQRAEIAEMKELLEQR